MTRPNLRWLPAVSAGALLALASFAPPRVTAESPGAELDYLYYPNCTWVTQGGVGDGSTHSLVAKEGLTQPLGEAGNIATVIVPMSKPANSGGLFDVVYWDPVALAPVPGAIALRTNRFTNTYLAVDASRMDLFPPLVTRALTNVAEPPPTHVAAQYHLDEWSATRTATFVPDDETTLPAALRIQADGTRVPLAGVHPVFFHETCGGDEALQNLRVVQCVTSTDATLDPNVEEYIQRFRVPVSTSVSWVELAFAQARASRWGRIRIVEAGAWTVPPPALDSGVLDAGISVWTDWTGGKWDSHLDLASSPTLHAGRDYWLVVAPAGVYTLGAKSLTGSESPYFTMSIGTLYRRAAWGAPAVPVPGKAMGFRIIGTPTTSVDVASPAPARSSFALTVAPNPGRGATTIAWSGARGDVRLEVLDPRGRRVAAMRSGSGESGRWSWSTIAEDGNPLPAGIYFVRARDAAGRSATARVTVVR